MLISNTFSSTVIFIVLLGLHRAFAVIGNETASYEPTNARHQVEVYDGVGTLTSSSTSLLPLQPPTASYNVTRTMTTTSIFQEEQQQPKHSIGDNVSVKEDDSLLNDGTKKKRKYLTLGPRSQIPNSANYPNQLTDVPHKSKLDGLDSKTSKDSMNFVQGFITASVLRNSSTVVPTNAHGYIQFQMNSEEPPLEKDQGKQETVKEVLTSLFPNGFSDIFRFTYSTENPLEKEAPTSSAPPAPSSKSNGTNYSVASTITSEYRRELKPGHTQIVVEKVEHASLPYTSSEEFRDGFNKITRDDLMRINRAAEDAPVLPSLLLKPEDPTNQTHTNETSKYPFKKDPIVILNESSSEFEEINEEDNQIAESQNIAHNYYQSVPFPSSNNQPEVNVHIIHEQKPGKQPIESYQQKHQIQPIPQVNPNQLNQIQEAPSRKFLKNFKPKLSESGSGPVPKGNFHYEALEAQKNDYADYKHPNLAQPKLNTQIVESKPLSQLPGYLNPPTYPTVFFKTEPKPDQKTEAPQSGIFVTVGTPLEKGSSIGHIESPHKYVSDAAGVATSETLTTSKPPVTFVEIQRSINIHNKLITEKNGRLVEQHETIYPQQEAKLIDYQSLSANPINVQHLDGEHDQYSEAASQKVNHHAKPSPESFVYKSLTSSDKHGPAYSHSSNYIQTHNPKAGNSVIHVTQDNAPHQDQHYKQPEQYATNHKYEHNALQPYNSQQKQDSDQGKAQQYYSQQQSQEYVQPNAQQHYNQEQGNPQQHYSQQQSQEYVQLNAQQNYNQEQGNAQQHYNQEQGNPQQHYNQQQSQEYAQPNAQQHYNQEQGNAQQHYSQQQTQGYDQNNGPIIQIALTAHESHHQENMPSDLHHQGSHYVTQDQNNFVQNAEQNHDHSGPNVEQQVQTLIHATEPIGEHGESLVHQPNPEEKQIYDRVSESVQHHSNELVQHHSIEPVQHHPIEPVHHHSNEPEHHHSVEPVHHHPIEPVHHHHHSNEPVHHHSNEPVHHHGPPIQPVPPQIPDHIHVHEHIQPHVHVEKHILGPAHHPQPHHPIEHPIYHSNPIHDHPHHRGPLAPPFGIVEKHIPVPYVVPEPVPVPVHVEHYIDRPYPVETIVEKRIPYPVETVVEKVVEKQVPVEVERIVEKPVEKVVEKFIDRPVAVPIHVPVAIHLPQHSSHDFGPSGFGASGMGGSPYGPTSYGPSSYGAWPQSPPTISHLPEKVLRNYYNRMLKKIAPQMSLMKFTPTRAPASKNPFKKQPKSLGSQKQKQTFKSNDSQLVDLSPPPPPSSASWSQGARYIYNTLPKDLIDSVASASGAALDRYKGPVRPTSVEPYDEFQRWRNGHSLKRSPDFGRNLQMEYGFKPPLVPSLEIDDKGMPLQSASEKPSK